MVRRLLLAIMSVVLVSCSSAGASDFFENPDIAEALRRSSGDFQTGVLTPCNVTINADPTKFDSVVCTGVVIDSSDPTNPVSTNVDIAARTAVADAFPASDTTWLLIDDTDTLSQVNVSPSAIERRDKIVIGSLVKAGGVIILTVDNQIPAYGLLKTFEDQLMMLGGMASDAVIGTSDNDLSLDVTAGEIISLGRGIPFDVKKPNTTLTPAQTPFPVGKLFKSYENVSGVVVIDPTTNQIDPNNFASAGVLTPVSAGKYTIQRGILFPATDVLALYYGNTEYDTLAEAASQLETEDWSEHPDTMAGAFRAWIIVQEGTTDLLAACEADPPKAAFISSGPLRPGIADSAQLPVGQIVAQVTDSTSQKPGVTTPVFVTFNTDDLLLGIGHDRPEDFKALTARALHFTIQYQVERTGSGGVVLWHGWLRQGRRDGDVTAVSVANPTVITSKDHRITTGQTVTISGCTTSASVNGANVATVVDANSYTIPVNVTVVTDGVCTWTRVLDAADDVANSNVEEALLTVNQEGVVTASFNVQPKEEDVFSFMQSVDDTTKGAGLVAKTPAGEPAIPSAHVSITVAGTQ
ncbi:hypothetical protein LCGC14_0436810 [marine sediment metagenome]|uniref:Uncharacterized protein n=1 Tax=marine sediment metagenome TaxID=412755 RepID=A0A0F9T4U5_9ZZZZ